MNLKDKTTMAWIYGVFFVLSVLAAVMLFKYLPSTAVAEGTLFGLTFNVGGAVAGSIGLFLALHFAYSEFLSGTGTGLRLSGNVLDDRDNPLEGAVVSVDGQIGDTRTNQTGWFQMDVGDRPSWTVRATKEGYDAGKIDIDANRNDEPVRILLKKKLN
jgi:hypothetical protein